LNFLQALFLSIFVKQNQDLRKEFKAERESFLESFGQEERLLSQEFCCPASSSQEEKTDCEGL